MSENAQPLRYSTAATRVETVPRASVLETLGVIAGVFIPTLAKGVIIRRPTVLAIAERLDLDRRAIRRMQRLRDQYNSGPLLLRIPGRSIALILHPRDVHRVLAETPEPFATAVPEKRAALAHFEPKNVLISEGVERVERRRFQEEVLDSHRPVHTLAESFLGVVDEEAGRLAATLRGHAELGWREFSDAWFRMVRRVVFGNAAAEDHELSETMAKLRHAANWAFLRPRRTALREELFERIRSYLVRAEPNSLAAFVSNVPVTGMTAPEHQIPQWLFAFDPAGMATFRALALLCANPHYAAIVRQEIATRGGDVRQDMPYLRASVLESLRLWPTTPLILRETLTDTEWAHGTIPAHTALVIYTPFFHRDDERLPYANRFEPELWMDEKNRKGAALAPFSEGPGICPGRHLVLLLGSAMLSSILQRWRVRLLNAGRLAQSEPLPATLNHLGLRFELGTFPFTSAP